MGKTYFENFDPEDVEGDYIYDKSVIGTPGITLLLGNCIATCGVWDFKSPYPKINLLKNSEYFDLADRVNELAKIGFDQRENADWIDCDERSSAEFDDHRTSQWACLGLKYSSTEDVAASQINGLYALRLIDSAISYVADEGWCDDTVGMLLAAAMMESEARDFFAADMFDRFAKNTEKEIEKGVKLRQSQIGKDAAEVRHLKVRAIKAEALRLYSAKTDWISRRQAAKSIYPMVQTFGKEKYKFQLSVDRVEQTVYEWLSQYDKLNNQT